MEGLGLDSSGSGQGQVVGCSECCSEPVGSLRCGPLLTSCRNVSSSRRTVVHIVRVA